MKISTILDHIDSGHMALPEFQRGYVWNRDQVRGLFDSLYRRHPVGGLLVWVTESKGAQHRGDGLLAPGVVKLLLDGQQRITSLYGAVRGKPPKFFDGNSSAFSGLRFHLETDVFEFYQPVKMQGDPLWIDVSTLMKQGTQGLGSFISAFANTTQESSRVGEYVGRLSKLLGIVDIDLHVEEVTGEEKTLDIVVDIFNRVNSGGTKLSKGDLALAKICAEWPDARDTMKSQLRTWEANGFNFNLDWLLRSVNTVLTGEAKFSFLHGRNAEEIQEGLRRAIRGIDKCLNIISGRLGLDHDAVLFGRFAIPVMVRFIDSLNGALDAKSRDRLLFWFAQAGMWGRFSGSTESFIDRDLSLIEGAGDPLDRLLEELRLWHGGLRAEAGHFVGWSLGARFYPVLYMLTRMGEAQDWGNGVPLKRHLLGRMSRLEVHHIFPKAQLYKRGYKRAEVNAVANFCFLTKDTNLQISDDLPEVYFSEIAEKHPGALESQWIPMDRNLWRIDNFLAFLEARRALLANETNVRMAELLHGDTKWIEQPAPTPAEQPIKVLVGIADDAEERQLSEVNDWIESVGLPRGTPRLEYSDPSTGTQLGVVDLCWPMGLQEGLSQPVALILDEEIEALALASSLGLRCFTDVQAFRDYVSKEVLSESSNTPTGQLSKELEPLLVGQ